MRSLVAAGFLALGAVAAQAQVSLDQLDKEVGARDKELAQFADRLNDPDAEKSLAAMKLLIEKGDADQRRMAIRFGLYSPDMATRETVMRAIFNSNPSLVMQMRPQSEKPGAGFRREIATLNGSYTPGGSASVVFKIDGYDADHGCWYRTYGPYKPCLARMTGDTVSFFVGDAWGQYTLDEKGLLKGIQTVRDEQVEGSVSLAE